MATATKKTEEFRDYSWIKGCDYRLVNSWEDWLAWKETASDLVCLDLETTGLNSELDKIVGVSLSGEPNSAIYVPLRHVDNNMPDIQRYLKDIMAFFQEEVVDTTRKSLNSKKKSSSSEGETLKKKRTFIAYNNKFDLSFLEKEGVYIDEKAAEDTLHSVFIQDCDALSLGLKAASERILNIQMIGLKELFPPKTKDLNFSLVDPLQENPDNPIITPTNYACSDSDVTRQLFMLLDKDREEQSFVYRIETMLLPALRRMESNGVLLDSDYLARLCYEAKERSTRLEQSIHMLAGKEFDILSNKQLGEVFKELNIEVPLSEKGNPSLGKLVLAGLSSQHKIAADILEYRKYRKAQGTYLKTLYEYSLKGRAMFRFNQCAAPTGRFSSGRDTAGGDIKGGSRKAKDAYIPINAQSIPSNDNAVWVDAFEIAERSSKETGDVFYRYKPWVLEEDYLDTEKKEED